MQPRSGSWFMGFAIGNGLASAFALAAAARGHWLVTATALAASVVLAAGMIKTMAAFRCGRPL